MWHRVAAMLLVTAAAAAWSTPATGSSDRSSGIRERSRVSEDGQAYELAAVIAEETRRASAARPPAERLEDYERAAYCRQDGAIWDKGAADGTCPPEAGYRGVGVVTCEEGDTHLLPMWVRRRDTPDSPWRDWAPADNGGCGVDILPRLTEADFRRLPLPAPALTVQPDRGWVLVNIETIVWTDPAPVTLRTDLLGHGVTVEATPARWTYDFGDGHELTTARPGAPYPDHDVFHEYEDVGEVAITLTTEWTGRYRLDGSPAWRDVAGTAHTSATSTPFTVEERTSRLVSGLCTDIPTPPDC